jgi:mRNA interferase MazF
VDLNPTKGREQSGRRPCLIISDDRLNRSPADLVIVVPITSKDKRIPSHVEMHPPEGGLKVRSFIKCEDVRSISTERLVTMLGTAKTATLESVAGRLRLLLGL